MTERTNSREWRRHATELANWTMTRLVNRTDVFGRYRKDGRAFTAPPKRQRGHQFLTRDCLDLHYHGGSGDLIGLHTTSRLNTSKWGAIDIDRKDESGPAKKTTEAAAIGFRDRLMKSGDEVLLTTSNGIGGFHVHVLFADPRPTQEVHSLLESVVFDSGQFGLSSKPEIFPKQPQIRPGGFGNWLRLPGRHPKSDHWSRVWNGHRWLSGRKAVDFVLGIGEGSLKSLKQTHCMCPNSKEEEIEEAVLATLPTGPGLRNRCIFELARRLKALIPGSTADELRQIVRKWHRLALPVIRTKPFTDTWMDFTTAWQRVKVPFGSSFSDIVKRAQELPLPKIALEYDDEAAQLLVRACVELQRFHGPDPFFLSCRKAGDLIAVSKSKAAGLLKMLVFDGVIEMAADGDREKKRATEYRCLIQ
ncbi:hypothetical protein OAJ60_01425 [Planctomycetaceae bacterium]|nr:hypothetical protein [Planctomycetaceae bacterium]